MKNKDVNQNFELNKEDFKRNYLKDIFAKISVYLYSSSKHNENFFNILNDINDQNQKLACENHIFLAMRANDIILHNLLNYDFDDGKLKLLVAKTALNNVKYAMQVKDYRLAKKSAGIALICFSNIKDSVSNEQYIADLAILYNYISTIYARFNDTLRQKAFKDENEKVRLLDANLMPINTYSPCYCLINELIAETYIYLSSYNGAIEYIRKCKLSLSSLVNSYSIPLNDAQIMMATYNAMLSLCYKKDFKGKQYETIIKEVEEDFPLFNEYSQPMYKYNDLLHYYWILSLSNEDSVIRSLQNPLICLFKKEGNHDLGNTVICEILVPLYHSNGQFKEEIDYLYKMINFEKALLSKEDNLKSCYLIGYYSLKLGDCCFDHNFNENASSHYQLAKDMLIKVYENTHCEIALFNLLKTNSSLIKYNIAIMNFKQANTLYENLKQEFLLLKAGEYFDKAMQIVNNAKAMLDMAR